MDCDDIYIGETGRTTRVRCLEHKSHARCKRTDHSAAADHVLLEGHKISGRLTSGAGVPVVKPEIKP